MERMALLTARSCKLSDGIFELFLFEVRETEVVVCASLVALKLDCCLEFCYRFVKSPQTAETHTHVET